MKKANDQVGSLKSDLSEVISDEAVLEIDIRRGKQVIKKLSAFVNFEKAKFKFMKLQYSPLSYATKRRCKHPPNSLSMIDVLKEQDKQVLNMMKAVKKMQEINEV